MKTRFNKSADHQEVPDRLKQTGRRAGPRAGWAEAFQAMSREGDDVLLDEEVVPTRWDEDEWRW